MEVYRGKEVETYGEQKVEAHRAKKQGMKRGEGDKTMEGKGQKQEKEEEKGKKRELERKDGGRRGPTDHP